MTNVITKLKLTPVGLRLKLNKVFKKSDDEHCELRT